MAAIVFCNQYPLPSQYFKNFTIPNQQQPFYCGQSVLLAHSKAYHLGKSILGANSSITYKNNGGYKIPLTNSSADADAVQRAWDFNEGWFSEPIYLTGDYPVTVKEYLSGFLRDFTDEEKKDILGSADFYAHDAYSAQFYMAPDAGLDSCVGNDTHPLYPTCANTTYNYSDEDGGWVVGPAADPGSPWLHKATDWVPAFLKYMQDTWVTPSPGPAKGVAVTEFGFSEPFESSKALLQDILYDTVRASYYHDYMEAILMAIAEGTNVVGCLAWSFVDNYVSVEYVSCARILKTTLTTVIHRNGNRATNLDLECNTSISPIRLYVSSLRPL
jgi:beta-glucosidase/6-phospho-beta-glucosidase/beta-galactosidase